MSTNLALSLEFVALLDWLLKHKKNEMEAFVAEATKDGSLFKNESIVEGEYTEVLDHVHDTVTTFVDFLEDALSHDLEVEGGGIEEFERRSAATIDTLDRAEIDPQVVWLSIQQARSDFLNSAIKGSDTKVQDKTLRAILLKKIIQNWVPQGDEAQA